MVNTIYKTVITEDQPLKKVKRKVQNIKMIHGLEIGRFFEFHQCRYCICSKKSTNWFEIGFNMPLVQIYKKKLQEK